jgi:ArsR family transcriptional regulator, virulence genes transcriptional regulator
MNLEKLNTKALEAETFLKSISSRHRLMILCELSKGELSVMPIQNILGLSQSALSQHLARLRADKLVKTRRESQTIYYSLASDKVTKMITFLYDLYCRDDAPDIA